MSGNLSALQVRSLILLWLATACHRTDSSPLVIHLADRIVPPLAAETLRVGDDWRPGLSVVRTAERILQTNFVVPAAATAPFAVELPPLAPGYDRELVVATQDGFAPPVERLRRQVAREAATGARILDVVFDPAEVGRRFHVSYLWRDTPSEPGSEIETAEIEVPSAAVLSLGIASSGGRRGAFTIEFVERRGRRTVLLDHAVAPDSDSWREIDLPLAGLAGRRGHFVLRHVATDGSRPLWGNPVVRAASGGPAASSGRPSFVVVSLDTLRADRMSAYGHMRATTPRLDRRLARHGLRFSRAYAPASSTAPSHMSLFTSVMPCVHGILGWFAEERLPGGLDTLAEVLRGQGYRTAAVTEDGFVGHTYGFTRGFDEFVEVREAEGAREAAAPRTFARARELLSELAPDSPFFLFAHTYKVHAPYVPASASLEAVTGHPGTEATAAIDRYDAEILELDVLLDHFLESVAALAADQPIFVILLADHGEAFGEHGFEGHRTGVSQELIRVPLVVFGPAIDGGIVDGDWSLVDVAPTILELARAPAWRGRAGESFAALLGGHSTETRDQPIHAESADQHYWTEIRGTRKILRHSARGAMTGFDLAPDGAEHQGITLEGKALGDARRALARYGRQCIEMTTALGLTPTRQQAAGRAWIEFDEDRIQRLRALGYL